VLAPQALLDLPNQRVGVAADARENLASVVPLAVGRRGSAVIRG
jgi:hypothetical protein